MPSARELFFQLNVIIYLSIKHEMIAIAGIDKWLCRRFRRINDGETLVAQGKFAQLRVPFLPAVTVRSAMLDDVDA